MLHKIVLYMNILYFEMNNKYEEYILLIMKNTQYNVLNMSAMTLQPDIDNDSCLSFRYFDLQC